MKNTQIRTTYASYLESMRLTANELRQFIRSTLLSEAYGNGDPWLDAAADALIDAGIPPVDRGSLGSAFLGHGSFSAAFKVNYKGKPRVAKVTSPAEAAQYAKWEAARNSAPPEVAKHMIAVFDIVKIYIEPSTNRPPLDRYDPNNWRAIITELLVPLNRGQAAGISGFDQQESMDRDAALWYHEGEGIIEATLSDLTPQDAQFLYDWLLNSLKGGKLTRGPGNVVHYMDEHDKKRMPPEVIDMLTNRATAKQRELFGWEWVRLRQLNNRKKKLPEMSSFDDPTEVNPADLDPTVAELREALIWFKKNGIAFEDVRRCNVMARPGGTVVISDPGMFRFS